MNVTISRKFQIAPYEMHEISISLSDTDMPEMSGSLVERLIEFRNLANKMLMAELYIYGALPSKEKIDAIHSKTKKAQNAMLKKEELEE